MGVKRALRQRQRHNDLYANKRMTRQRASAQRPSCRRVARHLFTLVKYRAAYAVAGAAAYYWHKIFSDLMCVNTHAYTRTATPPVTVGIAWQSVGGRR